VASAITLTLAINESRLLSHFAQVLILIKQDAKKKDRAKWPIDTNGFIH
jgi:hypothetical protein